MIVVKEPACNLDLNKLSANASDALIKLDGTFVGTRDYMGIAYFWSSFYKHTLRDSIKYWIPIHTALLDAGLNVSGCSSKHDEIIARIMKLGSKQLDYWEKERKEVERTAYEREQEVLKMPDNVIEVMYGKKAVEEVKKMRNKIEPKSTQVIFMIKLNKKSGLVLTSFGWLIGFYTAKGIFND